MTTALHSKLQVHSHMKWSYNVTYGNTSLSAFTECPFEKKKNKGKSALPLESINVKNNIINPIALRKAKNCIQFGLSVCNRVNAEPIPTPLPHLSVCGCYLTIK